MSGINELNNLHADAFEHLVNALALRVLGPGHTGFGPGADAGRDGYFEGEAAYPSDVDRWAGRWYIQSKFHATHLSKNPQKWLQERITEELTAFADPKAGRKWPDIWILATNVDPSGKADTGTFDACLKLIKKARPSLARRFHIWGGSKILALLNQFPEVAAYYKHFLTPGHVITSLYEHMQDQRADTSVILRYLIGTQFDEQQLTKLEQAGSDADKRPGIHSLFIDLPFCAPAFKVKGFITRYLVHAASCCQRIDPQQPSTPEWQQWRRHPQRGRIWFIKGGPGNGKSTIGQYFSQIQRAALLLQPDSIRVAPALIELAKEVKKVSERQGLWTSVPRIPIYIELKEYAQWYGSQDKGSARGVLSYLAQLMSARVEQDVLVGTLKRMLSSRAWFVMFDGLDEVPDDVKDSIAIEVRRFVDSTAIETDCDLLTVCTSRPQGYSGQFSDFDGPTIELSPLDAKQALNCAEPVIRFGRTESEAQKAIQILRSAVEAESEAVRSLMTTPLQSHIMAVVVRDGGKPPDRRWHLFDTFYYVIKRRETNRDLPDRAIASLLRDGHKLIKTVHNRLGFLLHARAETSHGAQTSLDREELRTLVSDAVSLMMEGDIDATIATLVRATTNRMVLVNTPDDGQHVRFDIRPLQEFFAAEFIYEAVDATKLKSRLETIAADAHWREVLHFVLSALIENGRFTEIDVAVEVLLSIDDSSAGTDQRTLRRRLAIGAVLAARLLQEGVLEQDKRIRQQFRKCIEPLLSSVFPRPLLPLLSVSQPNSLTWLLSVLIEHIREADRSESVGACMLLCNLLQDGDPRVSGCTRFLLESPLRYTMAVLEGHLATEEYKQVQAQEWVRNVAYSLLLGDGWGALTRAQISVLLAILRSGREPLAIAAKNGLPRSHVSLFSALLSREVFDHTATDYSEYGIIAVGYHANDWSTETVNYGRGDKKLGEDAPSAPGILQCVYRIFRFAEDRTVASLRELGLFLREYREAFNGLPSSVRAYAPIDEKTSLGEQVQFFCEGRESELEILIRSLRSRTPMVCRARNALHLGRDTDLKQWVRLVEDMPEIACTVWSDVFWSEINMERRPPILDTEEGASILGRKILQNPQLLIAQPLLSARLVRFAPQLEQNIRATMLKVASAYEPQAEHNYGQDAFALNLPREASLLPHIVSALVTDSHFAFNPVDISQRITQRRKLAAAFVPDIHSLEQVRGNVDARSDEQAAALFLSFLHPDGGAHKIRGEVDAILETFRSDIGTWFFVAAVSCVELLEDDDETANRIIGGLLEKARSRFDGRLILERLLVNWRERSRAPLSSIDVQRKWLVGSN